MIAVRASGNRWLPLVLLNSLLIQGAVYVVRPMMTYRAVDLGADSALVGAIGATFALAPLIFAISIGRWIDRGRDGAALFYGTVITLLTTVGLLFANQLWLLAIAMPFLGIGHLLIMLGGQTMIANRSADSKYEKNFGLITFYASLGHAAGPFIGGWLADKGEVIDTTTPLVFAICLFALASIMTVPLIKNVSKTKEQLVDFNPLSLRAVFAVPQFKSAIFVSGAITAVMDVYLIFMPLLGRQFGMTPTQIGILLAIRAISTMAVRIVLGTITQKFGMKNSLQFGSLVTLLSCVAVAVVTDFWWLALVMAIAGFAMGIGQPSTMAWVSRISDPAQRGLAISIRLTANRLGQVVVPSAAGLLATGGVGVVFLGLAALQASSMVVTSQALKKSD